MKHALTRVADQRIEGLDGLRALAVMLVMLFHTNLLGVGWIGVQGFFVLSGFLITRILLRLRERLGLRAYLRQFYGRRALRILPVYLAYLGLVLVLLGGATTDWWAAAGFVYNWAAMLPGHERSPWLTHLWSLAIEEQFYLLWPLLLYRLGNTGLHRLLLGLILAGPLLRLALFLLWPLGPPQIYAAVGICTLSQMDAFALGGLLCLPQAQAVDTRRWLLPAVVLVYGLGAWSAGPGLLATGITPLTLGFPNTLPGYFQFVWGYSAINLLAALLILSVQQPAAARLWRLPALAWIGRISYGLYLFHFPLAHALAPLIAQLQAATGLGVVSATLLWLPLYLGLLIAIAGLSFRYLEQPCLRLKERIFPSARIVPSA